MVGFIEGFNEIPSLEAMVQVLVEAVLMES
jgi:hypothetical protein